MSYIHFKSVVNTNFDKITFDGVSLPLAQLKKLISEKNKYTKQVDFDLEITNADTNEGKFISNMNLIIFLYLLINYYNLSLS